jgi:hypothetical protein
MLHQKEPTPERSQLPTVRASYRRVIAALELRWAWQTVELSDGLYQPLFTLPK